MAVTLEVVSDSWAILQSIEAGWIAHDSDSRACRNDRGNDIMPRHLAFGRKHDQKPSPSYGSLHRDARCRLRAGSGATARAGRQRAASEAGIRDPDLHRERGEASRPARALPEPHPSALREARDDECGVLESPGCAAVFKHAHLHHLASQPGDGDPKSTPLN